jgi:hypothetical protein
LTHYRVVLGVGALGEDEVRFIAGDVEQPNQRRPVEVVILKLGVEDHDPDVAQQTFGDAVGTAQPLGEFGPVVT